MRATCAGKHHSRAFGSCSILMLKVLEHGLQTGLLFFPTVNPKHVSAFTTHHFSTNCFVHNFKLGRLGAWILHVPLFSVLLGCNVMFLSPDTYLMNNSTSTLFQVYCIKTRSTYGISQNIISNQFTKAFCTIFF